MEYCCERPFALVYGAAKRLKACAVRLSACPCCQLTMYCLGCCPFTSCWGSQTLHAWDEAGYLRDSVRPHAAATFEVRRRQRLLRDTTWRGSDAVVRAGRRRASGTRSW